MKLRLNTKRELNGWIFVAPFVIGFILFFLYPLYQSILFSFSELEITPGGFKLHLSVGRITISCFLRMSSSVRCL